MKNTFWKALAIPMFVLAAIPALAQANSVEVAAGGGLASYHSNGESANKGKFDASVSYNILSNLSVGFEYGFSPLQSLKENISGVQLNGTDHLNSFGAVVRAGLFKEHRIQPYVLVAGGGARETASATASSGGFTESASESESGGYIGVGGGVNIYLTHRLGVRPEIRYQYLHIDGEHINEVDATGSIFYRFGGTHRRG